MASPLFFLRDWGADPPWYPPTPMGAVHAAGWVNEGPGLESGYGGGGGRGGGDILLAKAVPDGGAMEFRGVATYSGDTPRWEGGGESR